MDHAQGTETMRLLTLCSLAAASPVLGYDVDSKSASGVCRVLTQHLLIAHGIITNPGEDLSQIIIEITLLDARCCVRTEWGEDV